VRLVVVEGNSGITTVATEAELDAVNELLLGDLVEGAVGLAVGCLD
jgi:hypothetical protein